METVTFGPFSGYTSSVERFNTPQDKIATDSADVRRDPFTGGWYRRKGTTPVLSSNTAGMLESKWSARARQGLELVSPSLTSEPYPTPSVLFSNDTNASSFPTADTGYFGQLSVLNTNGSDEWYTLGSDFSSSSYPTSGSTFNTVHRYVVAPLWYESGAGGYTRGAFSFSRQFMLAGSRRMLDSGNWRYFPSLRGTPSRWNREFNNVTGSATTNTIRVMPSGPLPPLYPPTVAAGTASTGSDANWVDGDSFYVTVVYKFEDGSYSMPFMPRAKNATLTSGLGFVTVGTVGGASKYRDIQWTKIPQPPAGVTDIILARTGKQTLAATTDTLSIDMGTFYPVGIIRVGQTTFTDTLGNDAGLDEASDVIRFDYVMPRRARYIGTGDQRVLIGHTLPSPHAIMLAPTGSAATRDINAADDSATIYGSTQFIYRITETTLDFGWATGPSTGNAGVDYNATSITLSGKTLQDVVDTINATTTASASKQWAAQLCPGVDGSLAATYLAPTSYTITITTSNVSNTTTITTAASFADVPLGYKVAGTNISAGTYITAKASATSATISAAATGSHTAAYEFYADTGDGTIFDATGHGARGYGWIRAYAASFPGFAYLKRSAITGYDKPDRNGVYFTVGSPGAANAGVSLAPNAFVRYNRRVPSFNAGNLLGFADIQGAAVCAYSGGIAMFANIKGVNSGEDYDYKLFTVNPRRGAVGYGAVTEGNGWAAYATLDGIVAVDKTQAEIVLSNDIHNPVTESGSLAYELKASSASARSSDADSDGQRMHLAVVGTQLNVMYRSDSGVTVPNRRIVYDFAQGIESSGLAQVADSEARRPYGWSAPYTQSVGPVFAVVRSDDRHVYGCGEANAGTGDGRLDRLDYGSTDNGSAVQGVLYMPTVVAPPFTRFSMQRFVMKHYSPTTGPGITIWRNIARSSFGTASLTSGSSVVNNEVVPLTQSVRTVSDSMEFKWLDSASAVENAIWQVTVEYQPCRKH